MRIPSALRRVLAHGLGATLLLAACTDRDTATEPTTVDVAGSPQSIAENTARPTAEIEAVATALNVAWNAGDAVAYAASFAEDVEFIGPTGVRASGRTAIRNIHTFLFGGPFRGSTQNFTVKGVDFLGGRYALLELESRLTGFAGLPPGLTPNQPGLILGRTFLVLERRNGVWEIIRQQLTSVAPGIQ